MKILLFGDHIRALRSLLNALSVRGHKCNMKTGLKDIPEIGNFIDTDLIIIDLLDNENTGEYLLDKIKTTNENIPVYIVLGRDLPANIENRIKNKADKIFYKPLDIIQLEKSLALLEKN